MKSKILFLSLVSLLLSVAVFAQEHNPFKSIGKKGKVVTLSKGKYDEFFEKDSLERVGTVIVNRYTRKVERFLNEDSLNKSALKSEDQSRFLSVDPLAKMFSELSPYQYASNRPIDGIDLDGKEWSKVETFDPQSGKRNIQFEVKLKIVNESKLFKDAQALKTEIQKQFTEAFKEIAEKGSNTSYSASIQVEFVNEVSNSDFGAAITEGVKPRPGFASLAGNTTSVNTKENFVFINGSKYVGDKLVVKSAKNVAQDIVHELIHTGGVFFHPQDDQNEVEDVDLVPIFKPNGRLDTYILGRKAKLELIVHNILIYGDVKIDGKKVKEYEPDVFKRNKVSPGQAKAISRQIDEDEKKPKKNKK